MASKFLAIIEKNTQIMLNSKLSSLILILGPLFLILIIGSSVQDTSIKNINAGIILDENDGFSSNFIEKLKEQSFNVVTERSLEICKEQIKENKKHVCIEIKKTVQTTELESRNFQNNGGEIINYDIILHVDFSKQRVVWGIIGNIQSIIDEESKIIRNQKIQTINRNLESISEILKSNGREIDHLRASLNEIDDNLITLDKTRAEIIVELVSIKSSIGFLKNRLEAAPISPELIELELKLNSAIIRLQGQSVNPLRNSLTEVRSDLAGLKGSINALERDVEVIKNTDLTRVADPIFLTYESVSSSSQGSSENRLELLDFIFPTFLMIFILLTSLILATTLTIKERSSKANIRNITSKMSGIKIIFSNFITYTLLIFIQTAIILSISKFLLKLNLSLNLLSSIPIILLAISLFVLVGIALGYIFNSQETATSGGILVGLVLIMFSSIIIPVETLSPIISKIITIIPSVLLESNLRQSLIFNIPFSMSLKESISLSVSFLIVFILIWAGYSKSKEKEI